MSKKKGGRVHIVSLGCAKNLVDSEVMLATLELSGYEVAENPDDADVLLVNTCGFIRPAVEEAVDEILALAEYKNKNGGKKLVVAGCLVQRYGEALAAELPEVDLFLGVDEVERLPELLDADGLRGRIIHHVPPRYLMRAQTPRRLATPFYQAYLKLTEGCDNQCSYCLIPSIRGRLRSRSLDDLVGEAKELEQQGVRELNLIAQDLTAYGNDLDEAATLPRLLENLLHQTAIPWIRLLYLYPSSIETELLSLMAGESRIVPYLDIPFQHVSDSVLRKMNRRYGRDELEELLETIRRIVPECAIRTTILVGFPGETDNELKEILAFLRKWQLDHVGVFQYQDEEECLAYTFSGKVSDSEKEERFRRVMEVQSEISARRCHRFVGKVEPVLVAGFSQESELLLEGRTRFQAPEIDGVVYITEGTARPGDIVNVRISEAHIYDLVGRITGNSEEETGCPDTTG